MMRNEIITKIALIALIFNMGLVQLNAQMKKLELPEDLRMNSKEFPYRKDKIHNAFVKQKWKKPFAFYGPFTLDNYIKGQAQSEAKGNFFGTKSSKSVVQEWNYQLHATDMEPLDVNIAYSFSESLTNSFLIDILPIGIEFGNDELLFRKLYVSVFMDVPSGADPWVLLIGAAEGSQAPNEYIWKLTDGNRIIEVLPVQNEVKSKFKQNFAMFIDIPRGFVFREKGKGLAGIQVCTYNSKRHSRIWMEKNLSQEMQMTLSAAMSSILLMTLDLEFQSYILARVWDLPY